MEVFPVEAPWTNNIESSRAFMDVHLRLLMKERDKAVAWLMELDRLIWALEESLRGDPAANVPEETTVPKRSLSLAGGNPDSCA